MDKEELTAFFQPENSKAFPDLEVAFKVKRIRDFYDTRESKFWNKIWGSAVMMDLNNNKAKIDYVTADEIFLLEKKRMVSPSFTRLYEYLYSYLYRWQVITNMGRAAKRYNYLMQIAEEARDKEPLERIGWCYQAIKENMVYKHSFLIDVADLRYSLSTGAGVCRHQAPLLKDMLSRASIESSLVCSSPGPDYAHIWNRVTDQRMGTFDLDPSAYVLPTRLPPARNSSDLAWDRGDWLHEFYRLNNKKLLLDVCFG